MKRLFLLIVLLLFAFVLYNRQRVFVRDPLASVLHDGSKTTGTQVYLNFSNDVLLQNDGPQLLLTLVQHDRPVGTPANLKCLHWLACLTDADSASLASVETGARIIAMMNRSVEYRNAQGENVLVTLW